ncbi:MAG: MFS transporter [Gammaproteobacteria bacterium]|nr:MFS transporter [Gammaproteobacteria bacterium]
MTVKPTNERLLRVLTCMMFLMFAMTSDAVGSVIPKVIAEFHLSLKAGGTFHYVPMTAIALGAILLGFLADGIGRKRTIIVGLLLYGLSSLLFAFGSSFGFFVVLLALAGLGISIFKIGALALVGDISHSPRQHTSTMNLIEGFFGVGSIAGPAIVAALLTQGLSWKWLYVVAAVICAALTLVALAVRYPPVTHPPDEPVNLARTLRMMRDPCALGFSTLIMLYVAVEVAIYVWMPTYLQGYHGSYTWLATWSLTIFFVLRAGGRFLGIWLLQHFHWGAVLALLSFAVLACFAGSLAGGVGTGVLLLPCSGLFMSMLYPTLNSKGISCFPRFHHGAVAGVILFFTAAAAAAGPLAMAAVSDAYGGAQYGFALATAFAALLCAGLVYNWLRAPAERRLASAGA